VPAVMALLDQAGARAYAEAEMRTQHAQAEDALRAALGDSAAASPLLALANSLLHRSA